MLKVLLKRITLIPLHLTLWLLVWLFYIYFFSYSSNNENFTITFASSLLPITIIATYTIAYHLTPTYLLKKKYVRFGFYLVYTIIGSLFLIIILTFINFIFLFNYDMNNMPLLTRNFLFVFILVYLVVGLFSFAELLKHSYKTTNQNTLLEKKLLEGELLLKKRELSLLKKQIHPHFLFNTLNTIYGAALQESKDTPDLILKLSNLLDYTLNQIDKPKVSITEEVRYIQSYIGLEHVRFKDLLKVNFNHIIKKDIEVPPMLFIAFIENAFKHGSIIEDFIEVDIKLNVSNEKLIFKIKNTINYLKTQTENHGLGLENSKKRLEAIYPNHFILTTKKKENWFYLHLEITLT